MGFRRQEKNLCVLFFPQKSVEFRGKMHYFFPILDYTVILVVLRFLAIALELKDQRSQKLLKHCQMIKKTKCGGDLISLDLLY